MISLLFFPSFAIIDKKEPMSSGAKDSDATGFQMEQVLVSHPEQGHIALMYVGSS